MLAPGLEEAPRDATGPRTDRAPVLGLLGFPMFSRLCQVRLDVTFQQGSLGLNLDLAQGGQAGPQCPGR